MPTQGRPRKPKSQPVPNPLSAIYPNLDQLIAIGIKFAGSWIGQTMGYDDSPAHIWEIKMQGPFLNIETRWENSLRTGMFMGRIVEGEDAFLVGMDRKAILIDPQHFYIEGWDTNDIRGNIGPDYDVIFSRPGFAELNAEALWQKLKNQS
jgi:hypothetical protein